MSAKCNRPTVLTGDAHGGDYEVYYFLDVTPCGLVDLYRRFGRLY
jgi:hypothetical protein